MADRMLKGMGDALVAKVDSQTGAIHNLKAWCERHQLDKEFAAYASSPEFGLFMRDTGHLQVERTFQQKKDSEGNESPKWELTKMTSSFLVSEF